MGTHMIIPGYDLVGTHMIIPGYNLVGTHVIKPGYNLVCTHMIIPGGYNVLENINQIGNVSGKNISVDFTSRTSLQSGHALKR